MELSTIFNSSGKGVLIWNYQLFLTHLEKGYVDMEL